MLPTLLRAVKQRNFALEATKKMQKKDPNGSKWPLQCCKVPMVNKTLLSPYVQQVWDCLEAFLHTKGAMQKTMGKKKTPAFELFDLLSQACSVLRPLEVSPGAGGCFISDLIGFCSAIFAKNTYRYIKIDSDLS